MFISFLWEVRRKNMKNKTVKRKRETCWHPHCLPGKIDSAAANSNIIPRGSRSALPLFALHHVGAQTLHQRRSYEQLPTVDLHSWNINANTCSLSLAARKISQLNPYSPLFPEPPTNSLSYSLSLMSTLLWFILKQLCIAESTLQKLFNYKKPFHFICCHVGKTSSTGVLEWANLLGPPSSMESISLGSTGSLGLFSRHRHWYFWRVVLVINWNICNKNPVLTDMSDFCYSQA